VVDGRVELIEVVFLEGRDRGEAVGGVGTDGPIIREEGGREKGAVVISGDGLLQVVDEDEEEEGAKNTPLRYTVLDRLPIGILRGVYASHASVGEEGTQPQPRLPSDACVMDALKEDVVVYSIEGFLDVEEEDGALRGTALPLAPDDPLDGGEKVVDGV
jgi:hypothetical protein